VVEDLLLRLHLTIGAGVPTTRNNELAERTAIAGENVWYVLLRGAIAMTWSGSSEQSAKRSCSTIPRIEPDIHAGSVM
jgi:hypothetical protein